MAQSSATPQSETDQLRQRLAQKTAEAGQCAYLYEAPFIAGKTADVSATVAQIRAAFEKANPGETFGTDFKRTDKK